MSLTGKCAICLARLGEQSNAALLYCGHVFHHECLLQTKLHRSTKSCPTCRTGSITKVVYPLHNLMDDDFDPNDTLSIQVTKYSDGDIFLNEMTRSSDLQNQTCSNCERLKQEMETAALNHQAEKELHNGLMTGKAEELKNLEGVMRTLNQEITAKEKECSQTYNILRITIAAREQETKRIESLKMENDRLKAKIAQRTDLHSMPMAAFLEKYGSASSETTLWLAERYEEKKKVYDTIKQKYKELKSCYERNKVRLGIMEDELRKRRARIEALEEMRCESSKSSRIANSSTIRLQPTEMEMTSMPGSCISNTEPHLENSNSEQQETDTMFDSSINSDSHTKRDASAHLSVNLPGGFSIDDSCYVIQNGENTLPSQRNHSTVGAYKPTSHKQPTLFKKDVAKTRLIDWLAPPMSSKIAESKNNEIARKRSPLARNDCNNVITID